VNTLGGDKIQHHCSKGNYFETVGGKCFARMHQ
jgi:hypothetical protein